MRADPDLTEYLALRDKVDAFCAAATEASAGALRCEAGCSGCCVGGLTVSAVEARALRRALEETPLAGEPRAAADFACALLDADGRCSVYATRPLVCRTQGLALAYPAGLIPTDAIMHRDAAGRDVTHCPLNFEQQPPASAAVLDASRVDELLALVNFRFSQAQGLDANERVALSVLAGVCAT